MAVERTKRQPGRVDRVISLPIGQGIGRVLIYLGALLWISPLLWILSGAFKPEWAFATSRIVWIPTQPTLHNFADLIDPQGRAVNVVLAFANSAVVALASTFAALLTSSCAAFAFARLRFWGRDVIFMLLLATLMIPGEALLVPLFLEFYQYGLLNTYFALILPQLTSVLGVFLLRQFMLGIPREIEEAAYIDGASTFVVFRSIVLPLIRPALATLSVFVFLGSWNDFLWPLIVISKPAVMTLPLALITFQSGYQSMNYGSVMASTLVAIVPPLVLLAFAQNFIVQGISRTGIKG